MSDTNDNYEGEMCRMTDSKEKTWIEQNDTESPKRLCKESYQDGFMDFRDTIHAREMAKKDAEIERLKKIIAKYKKDDDDPLSFKNMNTPFNI